MKLFGQIAVHVKGEEILRKPGFLDKLKKVFGGEPDLRTAKVRASIEATALVDSVRDALRKLGVDNAVSLVVNDLVLFQDKEGRADDLGDLFLAFHEHSSVIGGTGFDLLRLTAEHDEAGLHLVIEVQAKSEHASTDPAVRVIASGRLRDLEPRKGEDAETYRKRVEPIAKDAGALEVARLQFESFVERARDAIAGAMPDARVQLVTAEVRVQRPAKDPDRARQPQDQDPRGRNYDPYDHYYPSPFHSMLSIMMWSSMFSMMHTPHYTVVNESNEPCGHTDDPGAEHADHGAGGDHGDSGGDHGDAGGDHGDSGGDGGDGGGGWGDWGGDGGGGGDFGGFD